MVKPGEVKVLSINKIPHLGAGGQNTFFYQIRFSFRDTLQDFIEIAAADYTAAKVREMIEKAVLTHAEILDM